MTKTLATREQAQAIRARMQQIRSDLPYDVDAAREQVRRLTDWRYHVKQHPMPILGAAAVVGYLLVPSVGDRHEVVVRTERGERVSEGLAAKPGLLSGLVGAVATMALRSGATMMAQHLSQSLLGGHRASIGGFGTAPSYAQNHTEHGVHNA